MQDVSLLAQMVAMFGTALVVAWLFRLLRGPSIVGFLICGILIGPSGLKLFTHEAVVQFAELGLILLLFAVGLELSPDLLVRAGGRILAAAAGQIVLTVLAGLCCLRLASDLGWPAALAVALAMTPSSTAIVLKQLADIRRTDSPLGMTLTGVSMIQDIMVILLMLFLPLFAGPGETGWIIGLGRGILSLAALLAGAAALRRALNPLTRMLLQAGGQELMTLFAVLMACAGAWIAQWAGWTPALGACIAGLLLAETDVRHQLFADIVPFRDVFNAMFFISMGMLVDVGLFVLQPATIIGGVLLVLIGKSLLGGAAVLLAGWPARLSVQVGMGLATISEFGFVVARESEELGLLATASLEVLTAVSCGTMIVGAALIPLAEKTSMIVERFLRRPDRAGEPRENGAHPPINVQVVIVGFGLNGQNLARVLRATNIPFSAVEMNPALAILARRAGDLAVIGDATRFSILRQAGILRARALVIAINDQQATRRIVAQARAARPDLYILARTRYTSELEILHRLGAQQVIPEEFETSIEIFAHVLKQFGIPDNVIEAQVTMIRAGNYGMLRGQPATTARRADLYSLLEATATQTFMIEPASPACGRTIRDMNLRAETGVTIIAVVRGGRPRTNPPPDMTLEAGDVLVLFGGHKQVDEAKARLSPAPISESQLKSIAPSQSTDPPFDAGPVP